MLHFVLTVLLFLLDVELLFLLHLQLRLNLLILAVVKVIIVEMLHLLHVAGDLRPMVHLLLLHLGVQVLNSRLFLLNF